MEPILIIHLQDIFLVLLVLLEDLVGREEWDGAEDLEGVEEWEEGGGKLGIEALRAV
jgi:hypothetical protein